MELTKRVSNDCTAEASFQHGMLDKWYTRHVHRSHTHLFSLSHVFIHSNRTFPNSKMALVHYPSTVYALLVSPVDNSMVPLVPVKWMSLVKNVKIGRMRMDRIKRVNSWSRAIHGPRDGESLCLWFLYSKSERERMSMILKSRQASLFGDWEGEDERNVVMWRWGNMSSIGMFSKPWEQWQRRQQQQQ